MEDLQAFANRHCKDLWFFELMDTFTIEVFEGPLKFTRLAKDHYQLFCPDDSDGSKRFILNAIGEFKRESFGGIAGYSKAIQDIRPKAQAMTPEEISDWFKRMDQSKYWSISPK